MYYNVFLYDNQELSFPYAPISFSSDFSQPYFEINLSDEENSQKLRFFINHNPDVPNGQIKYDYLGSGELYLNLENYLLGSINGVNIPKTYTYYTAIVEAFKNVQGVSLPQKNIDNICTIPADDIFSFTDNNYDVTITSNVVERTSQSVVPLCKNFTLHSDFMKVTSPNYKFANVIDDFPSCSHNTLGIDHTRCSFVGNFQSCPMYEPCSENLKSVSISKQNTDSIVVFTLQKLIALDDQYLFKIYNETEDTLVNEFSVSRKEDLSEEEIISHAHEVFAEILSSYKDDTFSDVTKESTNKEVKLSLIGSLI